MFFVLAGLGVLWLPAWLFLCRDQPHGSRFVNAAERELIVESIGSVRVILSCKQATQSIVIGKLSSRAK